MLAYMFASIELFFEESKMEDLKNEGFADDVGFLNLVDERNRVLQELRHIISNFCRPLALLNFENLKIYN